MPDGWPARQVLHLLHTSLIFFLQTLNWPADMAAIDRRLAMVVCAVNGAIGWVVCGTTDHHDASVWWPPKAA